MKRKRRSFDSAALRRRQFFRGVLERAGRQIWIRWSQGDMLVAMRALTLIFGLVLSSSLALGQTPTTAPAFDVASVKASQHQVGPDYNNQITYSPNGVTGGNVTLRRLLAEAYHLQHNLVLRPNRRVQNQ